MSTRNHLRLSLLRDHHNDPRKGRRGSRWNRVCGACHGHGLPGGCPGCGTVATEPYDRPGVTP